jgi:hypothetical protein
MTPVLIQLLTHRVWPIAFADNRPRDVTHLSRGTVEAENLSLCSSRYC